MSSLQNSATVWQTGGGWYIIPFDVGVLRLSGGLCAQTGCSFSCANIHVSWRFEVFLIKIRIKRYKCYVKK